MTVNGPGWKIPVKTMHVNQHCGQCNGDNAIALDIHTIDAEGAEYIATLVGCIDCQTGLCREDP